MSAVLLLRAAANEVTSGRGWFRVRARGSKRDGSIGRLAHDTMVIQLVVLRCASIGENSKVVVKWKYFNS